MTSADLLFACRQLARRLRIVGADVVEVIPTGVGSGDITALVAARLVHEVLTGLALRRLDDQAAAGRLSQATRAAIPAAASGTSAA